MQGYEDEMNIHIKNVKAELERQYQMQALKARQIVTELGLEGYDEITSIRDYRTDGRYDKQNTKKNDNYSTDNNEPR